MITHQLSFQHDISWDEIWKEWQQDEENQPFWQKIYQDLQFTSWDDWRKNCLKDVDFSNQKWQLYLLNDPFSFVAKAYCCPFPAWYKYYTKETVPSKTERDASFFAKIVPATSLSTNEKIQGILKKFPEKSQILGITDGNKVMIYEGHHRCSALTIAYLNKINIPNIKVTIALSKYTPTEFNKLFYPFPI